MLEAWNQSPSSPDAGSKTASVLESWGQVYGGNMTLAPTIHEFNVVLDAYAKNSSGNYDHYTNIISNGNNNGNNNNGNNNNNDNNNDNNNHSITSTIRAFSAWKRMLELVEAESKHNENNDTASERLI